MSSRSRNILKMALKTSGLDSVAETEIRNDSTNEESSLYSENKLINDMDQKFYEEKMNINQNNHGVQVLGYEILRCETEPLTTEENVIDMSSGNVIDIQNYVVDTEHGILLNEDIQMHMNESVNLQCPEQTVKCINQLDYNKTGYCVNNKPIPDEIDNTVCNDENHDPNFPICMNKEKDQKINIDREVDQEDDFINDVTYEPSADEINDIEEEYIEEINCNNEEQLEEEQERVEGNKGNRRKQKSDSLQWKKSVAKREKNLGNEYTNPAGKIFPKKRAKLVDCSKCKLKCNDKVTKEDIERIHECYWNTGSYERQRDFLCKYVKKKLISRRRKDTSPVNPRRNNTYTYYFPGDIQVCKKTFLSCLDISDKTIRLAKMKEIGGSSVVSKDRRGKHSPKNKTSEPRRTFVKKHIKSFPVMESHYCRSKTRRQYLSSELNITKMYELYVEKCTEENITDPVSSAVYRKIFCTEYNLGFHRPKKDSCSTCEKYKQSDDDKKHEMKETFDRHLRNKELSRMKKEDDKKRGEIDNSFKSVTFDLQSVLYTPCSEVSHFYYALKFCSYNLCVYDQATKDGFSYFWAETEGKRGSDEIGTALFTYLKSLPDTVKHVSLYSDSCGGQNRNRFIASLLLYAVKKLPIEIIEQNFLETGHTDMEVDSMHSAIETRKKHLRIYTPHEWPVVIRTARRKKPYVVQELSYNNILDLKALKLSLTSQKMSEDKDGNIINWMNIKMLQFRKTSPLTIFVKEDHSQENFTEMPIVSPKINRRTALEPELKKKYNKPLPISEKKKKSLVNLCRVDAMPAMYHNFYTSLPCSSNMVDRIPEPDQEETDCGAL